MKSPVNVLRHSAMMEKLAVLIPARRHEPALSPLVCGLLDTGFGAIILVDDGSPVEDKPLFDALGQIPRVRLLRHAANFGKGRALKTGIHHFLKELANCEGLVTVDADGQHSIDGIIRVATALLNEPKRAVLGCRDFRGDIPTRSRLGNAFTRRIFRFLCGHRVSDTQTGLRGFRRDLLPDLVELPGERYEYEMMVLAHLCREEGVPVEIPISTIYIDNNRSSSFSPLRDSMRIYLALLRFYASSRSSRLVSAYPDSAGTT